MPIIQTVIKGKEPVIDTLSVTPSTSAQQITAPQGTDGYSPVNVSAVTSSIDANIVAGNIKKDVTILGVTGSFEGGSTPTGTKNITSNGVHNVAAYEYADVQVPTTAPAYYIEMAVDANGKAQNGSYLMNFTGITDVNNYVFAYKYYQNAAITGTVDLSSLTTVSGQYACEYMFYGCTGLTSVDLSSLTTVSGRQACSYMLSGCTGLTTVNLNSLTSITGRQACSYMLSGCTGLTTVNLNSLTSLTGQQACYYMLSGCTGLTTVNLNSLTSLTGQQACSYMFNSCTGLTSVNLSGLVTTTGTSACSFMFAYCTNLASVNISRLAKIGTSQCLQVAFYGCTSLTELSFNGLAYTATNFNNAFDNMLSGCSNVTVHFPAEWQTDMASWSNVTAGFGGTNTTVLFDLPNVRTLDLSNITEININYLFSNFGSNNYFPNITKVDLSSLQRIAGDRACSYMFNGCTGLTSVDLSSLINVNANSACYYMFGNCSGLTTVNLSSLKTTSGSAELSQMFENCTSLSELKFPALKTISSVTSTFSSMLSGCSNVTVHFPSNFAQSIDPFYLGGTNTTVLKDLPAVVILTGADTVEYERNPKYDSATALAWRVNGTEPDTTTYYTSGLTDPTVGTTIYSDSACTVTETTVDSIS